MGYLDDKNEFEIKYEIQKRQAILDEGWKSVKRKRRFIGSRPVSEEEYQDYIQERYTSTGEEWEVDSDGLEYMPDWLS